MPKCVEEALEWLSQTACDQVGLFRKSGVRSRIQILRNLMESKGENLNFNEHQAYDVADMVKQFFRELPEALFTNKLSETFFLIFQRMLIFKLFLSCNINIIFRRTRSFTSRSCTLRFVINA